MAQHNIFGYQPSQLLPGDYFGFGPLPEPMKIGAEQSKVNQLKAALVPRPLDVKAFYNNPNYSDLTIKVNDKQFFVHRVVLDHIPFFKSLDHANMRDKNLVTIEEVSFINMELMLKFAYGYPLPILSFKETVTLFKETHLFLYTEFKTALWALLEYWRPQSIDHRIGCLLLDEMDTHRHMFDPNDFTSEVITKLEFSAFEYLVRTNSPATSDLVWKGVCVWIATHPDEPVSQLQHLMTLCRCVIQNHNDIEILTSYRSIPILSDMIMSALSQTCQQYLTRTGTNQKRPLPLSYEDVQTKRQRTA